MNTQTGHALGGTCWDTVMSLEEPRGAGGEPALSVRVRMRRGGGEVGGRQSQE